MHNRHKIALYITVSCYIKNKRCVYKRNIRNMAPDMPPYLNIHHMNTEPTLSQKMSVCHYSNFPSALSSCTEMTRISTYTQSMQGCYKYALSLVPRIPKNEPALNTPALLRIHNQIFIQHFYHSIPSPILFYYKVILVNNNM